MSGLFVDFRLVSYNNVNYILIKWSIVANASHYTCRKGCDMARPKRVEGEKTAYERMEDAFWEMLAEMPYHKMTGKEICIRAKVSHNSFYYHFDNMDDMAQKLFDRLVVPELPGIVLSALGTDNTALDGIKMIPDWDKRFFRMVLLANSGSPLLVNLVKSAVMKAWIQALGIKEADLSDEDRIDIAFILGGMFTLLGDGISSSDPEALSSFSEREVGQGVLKKIASLANRDRCSHARLEMNP